MEAGIGGNSMKNCIYCEKELPEGAFWCPYCEKEQQKAAVIKIPVRRRRWIAAGILTLVLLLAYAGTVSVLHRPKIFEGGAQVDYMLGTKPVRVYVTFESGAKADGGAVEVFRDCQMAGSGAVVPSQLFVWSGEDPKAYEKFAEQIRECTVTAFPEETKYKTMKVTAPVPSSQIGLKGIFVSNFRYSPETGTNRVCWELSMKNGDVIRLYQTVTCDELPVVEYHYEDTRMNTIEELQTLLEKIGREEDAKTLVRLFLPPVTYDGHLVLNQRTAILMGSSEETARTTFTGTLEIRTRKGGLAELYNIAFEGKGGTGLKLSEGAYVQGCRFTGWDIGVDSREGSWAILTNCEFETNGIGFRFDSMSATCSSQEYSGLLFRDNGIGVQLLHVPGDLPLGFTDCTFDENGTDIEDPKGLANVEQVR